MKLHTLNTLPLGRYANAQFYCGCGSTHRVATSEIIFGSGVAELCARSIMRIFPSLSRVFMLADGCEQLEHYLFKNQARVTRHDFVCGEFPVYSALKDIKVPADCRVIVGAGGIGVCNAAKYLGAVCSLPVYVFLTDCNAVNALAPSAQVQRDGFYELLRAAPPVGLCACLDSAASNSAETLAAGFGGVVSRLMSIFDWRLCSLLFGESYCEAVSELAYAAVHSLIESLEGLPSDAVQIAPLIFEHSLKISALNQLLGNSRLICGSEAHTALALKMMDEYSLVPLGQLEMVSCAVLARFYQSALFEHGGFIPPAYNVLRTELISKRLNVPMEMGFAKVHPLAPFGVVKEYCQTLTKHKDGLLVELEQCVALMHRANNVFLQLYAAPKIKCADFSLAAALGCDIREKNTALLALKQIGKFSF